jgi:actin-like protein 6B
MRRGIDLLPYQLITNKIVRYTICIFRSLSHNFIKPVEPNAPAQFTLRDDRIAGTTNTWRAWAESRELDEWIQSIAGVLEQGWNDQWVFFSISGGLTNNSFYW